MIEWIKANYTYLFGGTGIIVVIGGAIWAIIRFFIKKENNTKIVQTQKNKNSNGNIQQNIENINITYSNKSFTEVPKIEDKIVEYIKNNYACTTKQIAEEFNLEIDKTKEILKKQNNILIKNLYVDKTPDCDDCNWGFIK